MAMTIKRLFLLAIFVLSTRQATGQQTGVGCYDPTNNVCSCEEEVCDEAGCTDTGGIYTDQCSSCQCDIDAEDGGGGDGNSTTPEDEEEDKGEEVPQGFGCFDLPDVPMQCSCEASVCSNETCSSEGGIWTSRCTSCVCGETGDEGVEEVDDDSTGWGCYDIAVNRCGCDPEFCSKDACEDAGGTFTDGCGSCQCAETFPPGNDSISETEEPTINPGSVPETPEPTLPPTPAPTSDALSFNMRLGIMIAVTVSHCIM